MNILRLSTFSLTIILFSLGALMLPANTTLAHHCKGDHSGRKGCNGDTDFATYSVLISKAVSGASSTNWRGGFVGKKGIGLNVAGGPFTAENSVGQLTDLSFFTMSKDTEQGPFSGTRGLFCFGTTPVFLGQAILKQGKHGQAEGHFVFTGRTDDGMDTELQYRLAVFGRFGTGEDWPPSDPAKPTTMTMDTWEIGAGKGSTRTISCFGDGRFDDFPLNMLPQEMTIKVTLVEP